MNIAISEFLHAAIHVLLPKIVETAENGTLLAAVKAAIADPAHCIAAVKKEIETK